MSLNILPFEKVFFHRCGFLSEMDLNENANPNKNFETFIDNFTKFKQQCMPRKRVRYDKKLHKDNHWMTTGILKSIIAKDKLYKVLKQTSKESLKLCRYPKKI